ncbi:phenylalanine--tRNA ligase subunit beta [Anaerocaecibacter muris]|uniref:phenylalanine--tRNA ligase subunit beta n=1 Tax=Anaerocaecibacter muris TaxID=2941513 RepID=UPI002041D771|nr:phenylalanine--tRNA ligase subunit beta [Anaerocaecibacter muris]
MKLPLSWLKDYVDIGDVTPQELSDKLLSIGFEVEEIIAPRNDISGVVVGRVMNIVHHDNSDKLWVCNIDIGEKYVQIVTGAQNVKLGNYVPVATVGAVLPDGKKISEAKLRGVDSFGMLCGGSELGVDDDIIEGASVDGILILPDDSVIGDDILHTLGLDDTVLDVSITANRPDCQAIVNIAREISILLDKKFVMPKLTYKCRCICDMPPVTIENKELCSRYIGRAICNVKIEKSPKWMRDRLRMCGIRPINNLVDITNYVLLEFGQPLHAFDKKFIQDKVIVRKGRDGERITALDGKKYDVNNILVIADTCKPLAIAGIMGGEYTSIFPDTQDVFLEAARFERSNVRRTSRKIGLRSDSSARYEKGVDWQSVELGSNRALALIDQLKCGNICSNIVYDSTEQPVEKQIVTTTDQICSLLGIEIDKKIIISILKKQGFQVRTAANTLICTVPLVREDIDGYPDLAEDIMRFYGYENIVSTNSENTHQTSGGRNVHDDNIETVKSVMRALGADEILNYSFISPDEADKLLLDGNDAMRRCIPIKNPLSRDISVMRTQLISSMLNSIARNCARKNDVMRFYELGKTFITNELPITDLPQERDVICVALCNDGDFYTLKAIVGELANVFGMPEYSACKCSYLHPKQSLHVSCDGVSGDFGKLHPLVCENYNLPNNVYVAQLDLTDALNRPIALAQYMPISKLQPVDRDLALVVKKDVAVGDMLNDVKSVSPYIAQVKLFDIYDGAQIEEGYKSVAFSMRLQPTVNTFSDAEIKNIMNSVIDNAATKFGAKLR